MRSTRVTRDTTETQIALALNLDGRGVYDIRSGCGFLDHMLELFARHGWFDLTLECRGDTRVDDHHTVEDIAIALGAACKACLGDKRGIVRYGDQLLPMDEALAQIALDCSGRAHLSFDARFPTEKVGSFDTELVEEFFRGFVRGGEMTLHVRALAGTNSHHMIEAIFKAFGRALHKACAIDPEYAEEIPSTKGVL